MAEDSKARPERLIHKVVLGISFVVGGVVFAVCFFLRTSEPLDLVVSLGTVAAMTLLTVAMLRFKLMAWLFIAWLGYLAGLISASQLLAVPEVEDGYRAASLTLAVYAAHGLAFGGFAELVAWLQRLSGRAFRAVRNKISSTDTIDRMSRQSGADDDTRNHRE